MNLLLKHFWIAFILATIANGAIWWSRGRSERERYPAVGEGYRRLVLGYVIWGNIPWIIMGAGILFGGVPTIFHYFDPKYPSPFVAAWFLSIFVIWIAGTWWLFARGGAEELSRHHGMLNVQSATSIKLFWCLAVAGGVVAVALMYLSDNPVPNLR